MSERADVKKAKGVYAIGTTPFQKDGSLDAASLARLTEYYAECGASGITVLGIMGEALKLTPEESLEVVNLVMKRAEVPVIVGASAAGFATMRRLARSALEAGATGVMIAPPHHLRTDDQIRVYYEQAVNAIGQDVPFVIQDHPLALSVVMTAEVIRDIVNAHSSCIMLKHEDWPGLEKISRLREYQSVGQMREMPILCGNGGIFLDLEISRGADGAMTGYAFTDALVEIVGAHLASDQKRAHDLFDAHLPLMRYEQQPSIGLAVRKSLLHRRGVITDPRQRAPSAELSEAAQAEIDLLLHRLQRLDHRAGSGLPVMNVYQES